MSGVFHCDNPEEIDEEELGYLGEHLLCGAQPVINGRPHYNIGFNSITIRAFRKEYKARWTKLRLCKNCIRVLVTL